MITSVRLCELVTIRGGGTPDRQNPDYWDGDIPWASVKDLKDIRLENTQEFITEKGVKNSATNIIPSGTIVVATRMAVGRACITGLPVAINQDLKALFCSPELLPQYLLWFLLSVSKKLEVQASGATVKGIKIDALNQLKIPLFPLEEQRRIAAILDKADAVRRKRQQAIALTEELLRSAFLEMFGDPVTNPKGWKIRQLEDFSIIRSGIAKGKKVEQSKAVSVPYMRVANVQDGYLDLSKVKELKVLSTDVNKYTLQKGDLLLTEGGDPDKLGRGSIWYGEIQPCIHQNHIFCVRPDRALAEPEYISALIGSERGKRYFLQAAKQTTGIATINKTQLRCFPALLPPLYLQQKYTQFVKLIRSTRKHLEDKHERVDQLFNSLLQAAFRGEL